MPIPLNTTAPHKLTSDLVDSMKAVASAAVESDNFDPDAYRIELGHALADMKEATVRVATSAHIGGMEKIGAVAVLLKDLSSKTRSIQADEIFWDQLSQYYPVKGDWGISHNHLSTGLQLRLLQQMISQEPEPEKVVRNQLQGMSDDAFMDGFTVALKLLEPSEIRFSAHFYEVLFTLKLRASKPDLMPGIVEHIAAHQTLYFGFLERIVKLASLPIFLKQNLGEEMVDLIERNQRQVLGLMGYTVTEVELMIESGGVREVLPKSHDQGRMKKALSFPAEFLYLLHQATGHPLVLEVAEIALDDPTGRMPFKFFEQMGITRSQEWFTKIQEKSGIGKAVVIFEHAIHTPGLELALGRVKRQPLMSFEPGLIERLISIVENVPVTNPDAMRKGQELFDALVENMESGKSPPLLKQLLESCQAPRIFYGKHKALKVARLENELGM